MENLNLVVKFKLAGDSRVHVKGATRIQVGGGCGLMVYDSESGAAEKIDFRELRSFCIQPVHAVSQAI